MHLQAQNLAGFAFDTDFHRATAHFAVNGEALKRYAGINRGFERLAAKRTTNGFNGFHAVDWAHQPQNGPIPYVGKRCLRPAAKVSKVL